MQRMPSVATGRFLVIVAEDDGAMRSMLAASLRGAGCEVLEAESGGKLLQKLRQAHASGSAPDLVITDLQMPEATGLDALHWLGECMPEVPAILITAFGDARTHSRAKELGAAFVIDKPFGLSELHRRVFEVLDA